MTDDPNKPSGTVPPYEGRRETADLDGADRAYRDGANVGGATGPVENAGAASDTGGGTGSPADEQPASEVTESRGDDTGTGPAHEPGTPRGEDQA
jgi:hypothetical protein